MIRNKKICLKSRPDETFPLNIDFFCTLFDEINLQKIQEGCYVVQVVYLSTDPIMRTWFSGAQTYLDPVSLNTAVPSFGVGEIVYSNSQQFEIGDLVSGVMSWSTYFIGNENAKALMKVPFPKQLGNIYRVLTILGPTGLTAYLGLKEVGEIQQNQVLLVSSAAGATGSVAVQLGQYWGCRVIGIAGSDEKCEFVEQELGADSCINYQKYPQLKEEIQKRVGKKSGVDIYFDNVGEDQLDAAIANINKGGRIVFCGATATYANWKNQQGIKNTNQLIFQGAQIQGILYFGEQKKLIQAGLQMFNIVSQGFVIDNHQIFQGLQSAPNALKKYFSGENQGQILIEIDMTIDHLPFNAPKL